ncbi:flagellar basal body P-ring formation protein FlgA [Stappia taiwanensis]|uniref:Flagellar basal body P-ring formation protein FlgA n=1 Tax=Stappia taiwanensis TaxID=992267 RepID=A0A838XTS3_9HYPH|nr:flagellar basal body P-ring formation chaperone FlgA [Stappia taiwanensis]MBA4610454.1 flagellar basal body P-ring formation protein FlgA [Stappia taiwanensis]GGE84814.1 flagellar basal body P-ring biosynthesis protein FlgA [Stappia taiwanensis]
MSFTRTVLALSLLLSATLPAVAAGALRSEVQVAAAIVTLGDFYPDAGPLAATPLFRAPDLGTRGTVPAAMVAERARAAGYAAAGTDGLRQVTVERLAVTIGTSELETAIRAALVERHPQLDPEALEITFTGTPEMIRADASIPDPLRVTAINWHPASGRLSARLQIHTGTRLESRQVTGTATEMATVFAAAAPLDRGAIVTAADLKPHRIPRNRLTGQQVADMAAIAGLAARRSIRPGRPLMKTDFEEPTLVRRGDKVTLYYRVAGMTLTTIGQALANGTDGDVIDVLNLQSRRTVSGTVKARGQVEVGLARHRMAQLQETIR